MPKRNGRPLIAVPGRFSQSASALRFGAVVNARALLEAVFAAGGEPVTVLPSGPNAATDFAADRLAFADAVLLPGGADVSPARYGASPHPASDAPDEVQDFFDLAAASWALEHGVPLLAICRGMHVVNVSLGGSLEQDIGDAHRTVIHHVLIEGKSVLRPVFDGQAAVSCYHHQRLDRLGEGLVATATAGDGTIEAIELPTARGWFVGVQWHPEDTAAADSAQLHLLEEFVNAAAGSA